MRVVLVRNPSCAAVLGSRVVSCTRSLPWMQLVCIVIPNVIVGNFQIPHQCNALIDHLIPQWSSQDIIYASCDQIKVLWWISNSSKNFLPIKIQSIPQSRTYSFRSCSQLFELKKRVSLLSMHCMAYALGIWGELTSIRMEIFILISYLSFGDVVVP
jgi:hypothetical protein